MRIEIEDITPDFFAFWERAEGHGLEEQRSLWRAMYEAPHREIFEVYYSSYGDPGGLDAALRRFARDVPRMRSLVPTVHQDTESLMPRCGEVFATRGVDLRYVLMVGLYSSNAWATFLRGRLASFLALELAGERRPLQVLIAHEASHALHRHCTPIPEDIATLTTGETLFLEGLATLASTLVVRGATEAEYLTLDASTIADCEARWPELRSRLSRDLSRPAWVAPAPYFLGSDEPLQPGVPVRSGYFVGYQLVRHLGRDYTVAEMACWSLQHAVARVQETLERMTELAAKV